METDVSKKCFVDSLDSLSCLFIVECSHRRVQIPQDIHLCDIHREPEATRKQTSECGPAKRL